MDPPERTSKAPAPSPPEPPPSTGRIKHYFYYGHRASGRSPHRPTVRSPPISHPKTRTPEPPPKPFSLSNWHPNSTSPPPLLPPPCSPLLSDRRLSPIARFILGSLRRHKRWGPLVLSDLAKLRHVSPPLVTEILRSRPPLPPSLSTPFFLWAGKQKNFRHEYASFNAYAHLLSLTHQPGLVNQIPDMMRCHGKNPTEKQLDVLVKLHSQAGRPLRALETFRRMRSEFGIKSRVFLYNRVFEALVKWGHIDEALSLYQNEFRKDGLKEEAITFTILAKGLSRVGRVENVLDLLDQMRMRVCKPDLFAYTSLVKVMANRGNMDGCLRIWEEMKRDGIESDSMGYATIILGLCKVGKVDKAHELFDEMRRKEMLIDRSIFGALIEGFVSQKRVGEGLGILKEMVDKEYRADLGIYDSLIGGLCDLKLVEKACKLFEIMIKEGLEPGYKTTTPLLVFYADLGKIDEFDKFVCRISELHLPVNDHLIEFLKSYLEKGERESNALKVLDEMKKKGHSSVGIYNLLIESLYKAKDRKMAISLFNEILGLENSHPDSDTYNLIIPCFVEENNVKKACSYYNIMMEKSYTPSSNVYSSLVKGLCKIGQINSAINLVKHCLGTLTSGPMEFKYALTILNACKTKSPEKVIEILDEMSELGYPFEEIIYYAIIHGFCKHASSAEARKVFAVLRKRGDLRDVDFIAYEEILNEHLKKVTAELVISGLKFFGLENDLKWSTNLDESS